MPLHTYKCKYGHISEELYRQGDKVYGSIECEICSEVSYKELPMVASTPSKWGDSHGYFNRDLNCYIKNSQHHDQVLKEQGLVVTTKNNLMDQAQRKENWIKETDKKTAELKQMIATTPV
tara:strand:+ start:1839 stop:2198 length:360 start_codon:yes stop_codon:yes gene_type:complete